ncbi:hypothetical protein [Cupriavidus pampae]|uniref:Alpha/beta hydrolase n=1 Tax=Cupriavidus pampae TaxID=659251 RepID=A0ABN7Y2I1_9BURK|nr:hypothetical protein [Cupriavidus pampae]CAG9166140.1 hypothetical protein LMG32289_00936 [Cupriavidus pampae]
MPFLFFHGIAQERSNQNELRKLWIESIETGLERAGSPVSLRDAIVEMPFYGELLADAKSGGPAENSYRDQDNLTRTRNGRKTDSGGDDIKLEFITEIAREKSRQTDKDNLNRGVMSGSLRMLSSILPNKVQAAFVDLVLSQVAAYLASREVHSAISKMADAAMLAAHQARSGADRRFVVVAHSLGTVVALEALWRWRSEPIDLLVTIGSPLSVGCIRSRLAMDPPRWPKSVRQWINVADRDDIVALHGALDRSNLFESCTSLNTIERADVLNVLDIRNHMGNHHGIAGYLDDPVVARLIYAFPE